ncbi:MAG: sigma-70 family RNA polymerase sigma factor [Nanoarchaeota archaeon]
MQQRHYNDSIRDLDFQRDINKSNEYVAEDRLQSNDRIKTRRSLTIYLNETSKYPLLTSDEELTYGKLIREGITKEIQEDARNKLVQSNLRLVLNVGKRYKYFRRYPGLLQDLIQGGNLGLIQAATKFDYTKGYKFSTYAIWWIRQAMTRIIQSDYRLINVPIYKQDELYKIIAARKLLKNTKGNDPELEEIASETKLPVKRIEQILIDCRETVSLHSPCVPGDSDAKPLDHMITAPQINWDESFVRGKIEDVLETITKREADIIKFRHGLYDGSPLTLTQVGEIFGLTRERVRQIEATALNKLRHPSRSRQLRDLYIQGE